MKSADDIIRTLGLKPQDIRVVADVDTAKDYRCH